MEKREEKGGELGRFRALFLACVAPAEPREIPRQHGIPGNKKPAARAGFSWNIGGADGDRTHDLRIANATLSQLSYRPVICQRGSGWPGGRPVRGAHDSRARRGAPSRAGRTRPASVRSVPKPCRWRTCVRCDGAVSGLRSRGALLPGWGLKRRPGVPSAHRAGFRGASHRAQQATGASATGLRGGGGRRAGRRAGQVRQRVR